MGDVAHAGLIEGVIAKNGGIAPLSSKIRGKRCMQRNTAGWLNFDFSVSKAT